MSPLGLMLQESGPFVVARIDELEYPLARNRGSCDVGFEGKMKIMREGLFTGFEIKMHSPGIPRLNLTRFHGVFAPNCKHRQHIVPRRDAVKEPKDKPCAPMTWMQRLKRVFAIDIETCPKCGGKLRVIACIEDPDVIATILEHIRPRDEAQPPQPRAPPRRTQHPDTPNQDRLF